MFKEQQRKQHFLMQMMLKMVLAMMRKSVKKKAGFDINNVAPIDLVPNSIIPAVFGHGTDDSFINSYHSGGQGYCYSK